MQIFGWELRRIEKAAPLLQPADARGGWFPVVREPFTGAWQRNEEVQVDTALSFSAVYACVSLIASDIGKMGVRLMERDGQGIWTELEANSPFWPVIRKPNRYQNRIKFYEAWIYSKLIQGNAYALKQRDSRGIVTALYVLDPYKCKALVAPDGQVFYELKRDNLSGIEDETVIVPASEIIHDVMSALYHPLCGVSPIQAAGLAILGGSAMQKNSALFFRNGSNPGGILTAPGAILPEEVERIRAQWEQKYSGDNSGRVAVLGGGLAYTPMSVNAVDAELIDQLKLSAETVCSVFHVPAYMIGVGQAPTYNNIEALNQQYYQQCLQTLIESIELGLDEGLGLVDVPGKTLGVGFDTDDLLRMDTAAKVKAAADGIKAGLFAPNEQRKKFDLPPKPGGDTPYLQQQNYSLSALDKRDQSADPFAKTTPAPAPAAVDDDEIDEEQLALMTALHTKRLSDAARSTA
jgi:HK97 family phage portal protein